MECPVCFEVFQTPLLLPGCGHTICRACAELLVQDGNYLRCPECRLMYQLRQGVKSLPKNVALERTIDEHTQNANKSNVMCEQHPEDAAALYCKTCEKSICLKCYFSNTLRKGQSMNMHTGHQVDTSEDAFSKELRMLQENLRKSEQRRNVERQYIFKLEKSQDTLKELLEEKLAAIDTQKNDIVKHVSQTASKLKFTLKGTMVRDKEYLEMALQSARERMDRLDVEVDHGDGVLVKAACDQNDVTTVKETRKRLEAIEDPTETERPAPESFLKLAHFDTDIRTCMEDSKKALSYQTEIPRTPEVCTEECIISDTTAFITVKYSETVRVKKLTLSYKEALYKGMSEKKWDSVDIEDVAKGRGKIVLKELSRGTMYKVYAIATNDFGDSDQSKEVMFRTVDTEVEIRST